MAVSLTAVLVVAIPTLMELSRAARSAEKLFDTLGRELPPTLEALRLTGLEITELTEDVSDGVEHAGRVVQQVDASLTAARQQAKTLQAGSRSFSGRSQSRLANLDPDIQTFPPSAGKACPAENPRRLNAPSPVSIPAGPDQRSSQRNKPNIPLG